jgi:hypothetical protein
MDGQSADTAGWNGPLGCRLRVRLWPPRQLYSWATRSLRVTSVTPFTRLTARMIFCR